MVARQYTLYVAIKDGSTQTKSLSQDGGSCRAPDARQGFKLLLTGGEFPLVIPNDELSCFLKIAGTGVIPEAGPVPQNVVYRCFGQGPNIRKPGHKGLIVWNNRRHLGLLQHDFRHPDPVGGPVVMPGQVFPAVVVIPAQKPFGKTL